MSMKTIVTFTMNLAIDKSSSLVVLEESTGQQFRFGMPCPVLSNEEWERCLYELSTISPKPDYLVASGSLPPGVPSVFYARVARTGNLDILKKTSDSESGG